MKYPPEDWASSGIRKGSAPEEKDVTLLEKTPGKCFY